MVLEVNDDSGFLAVVVPAAYEGFVHSDWQFDQLLGHFQTQMARRSLLIWGTGLEGIWRVDVRQRRSHARGFREVSGPIRVVGGAVLVTNYESLTMAAQFADVRLPEQHQRDLVVEFPDGEYACRVVQMFDPSAGVSAGAGKPDFVLEFTQTAVALESWPGVPWFEAEPGAAADGGGDTGF
jgi:hypothetical protein